MFREGYSGTDECVLSQCCFTGKANPEGGKEPRPECRDYRASSLNWEVGLESYKDIGQCGDMGSKVTPRWGSQRQEKSVAERIT